MKIYSVFDPEFQHYGNIVEGLEETKQELLEALKGILPTEGVSYSPEIPELQELPAAVEVSEHLYGGMPVELGCCYGRNTMLNCLEYHRDSEFNLSPDDMILLLARQDEIEDGVLDTAKVKAFRIPAGTLVEVYATTLHYAPCHCDAEKGFRSLVVLPAGTNLERPDIPVKTPEDRLLWARNKWLLAHPDSGEAKQGAYVGLKGKNLCTAE